MRHNDRVRLVAALLMGAALAPAAVAQTLQVDGFESELCGWSDRSLDFLATFGGNDGDPWPAPWTVAGGVATADLAGNRGRILPVPSSYSLGRMKAAVATSDVEVAFTLVFEDQGSQGVGLYVRQNGGYLQQTPTHGQGYAVFAEGFRGFPRLGLWKEQNGVESELYHLDLPVPFAFTNGAPYGVRFRVEQQDAATTHLYGKVWALAGAEPAAWTVEGTDTTPVLQSISGGIAVDSWSSHTAPTAITAHTLVDDVAVRGICPHGP